MPPALRRVVSTCWRYVGHVLTAVALLLDALLSPLVDPLTDWLSDQPAIRAMERGIAALPPYAILVLAAVPVVLRQGIKLFAFFLMASGDPLVGGAIYFGSRLANIFIVERIYNAGREQLLSIAWFEKAHDWLHRRSEKRLAAFRATPVYGWASRTFHLEDRSRA